MVGHFTGWVPLNFLTNHVESGSHTLLISNVPGGSEIDFLGVGMLEKIIPLAPNFRDTGMRTRLCFLITYINMIFYIHFDLGIQLFCPSDKT